VVGTGSREGNASGKEQQDVALRDENIICQTRLKLLRMNARPCAGHFRLKRLFELSA
jgi:hypothetical protein